MDSGKKIVKELFSSVCVDGTEYIPAEEVIRYIEQQQKLEDALKTIQTSLGQLGKSFGNMQDSIGNLEGELKEAKI